MLQPSRKGRSNLSSAPDRPASRSRHPKPRWGAGASGRGFTARLACAFDRRAEHARDFARDLIASGTYTGDSLGRLIGNADGTQVYRLLSPTGAVSRSLVNALAYLEQEMGSARITQAGCAGGFVVVPMPGSPPPGDFFAWLASMGESLRSALMSSH